MLHWPAASACSEGLVCCYPFGEERKCSARTMTRAARRLCQRGYHVLRFDYFGTGESDGYMEQASIERWMQDIHRAINHVRERTKVSQVGLLGVRFGATLAALYDRAPLSSLVLWAPLASGRECIDQARRHLAATRLLATPGGDVRTTQTPADAEDMGGFYLSCRMRAEMESLCLSNQTFVPEGRVVVGHASSRQAAAPEWQAIASGQAAAGNLLTMFAMGIRPFWMTASRYDPAELVDRTIEALEGPADREVSVRRCQDA
jgi:pimeloyl-ACP methyl ester carboxylesterase